MKFHGRQAVEFHPERSEGLSKTMDIHELWTKALRHTEIIRGRVSALQTFQETRVPYILLSESSINAGDTVVRRGEVLVERPSIILPPNIPQFEGFDFEQKENFNENSMVNFLMVRGVALPSLKYNNLTHKLDVFEGGLSQAVKHHLDNLQCMENVSTGLLVGPEDAWQFSVLIFIGAQIAKNTELDLRRLMEEFRKRNQ